MKQKLIKRADAFGRMKSATLESSPEIVGTGSAKRKYATSLGREVLPPCAASTGKWPGRSNSSILGAEQNSRKCAPGQRLQRLTIIKNEKRRPNLLHRSKSGCASGQWPAL
jgi:hypothetical protein